MKLLTNEQLQSPENTNICYICKVNFSIFNYIGKFENKLKDKYPEVRDDCHYAGKYRGAANSIYNLKYRVPERTPVVFYNGSNYNYHFIIKELAKEF